MALVRFDIWRDPGEPSWPTLRFSLSQGHILRREENSPQYWGGNLKPEAFPKPGSYPEKGGKQPAILGRDETWTLRLSLSQGFILRREKNSPQY